MNAEQLAFSPYQNQAFLTYGHTTRNVPDLLTTEPGISRHRQAQSLAMHDLAGTCIQLSLRRHKATFKAGPRTHRPLVPEIGPLWLGRPALGFPRHRMGLIGWPSNLPIWKSPLPTSPLPRSSVSEREQQYLVSNYWVSGTALGTQWRRSNTTATSCSSLERAGLEKGCGPRVLGERDQAGLASR